ncbi:MAG: hypothetical protein PWP46_469 [Fusobacteriaceae bacterium]|jgi:hypothetical protein|nr:hypothetical protein [Fusobacteriaceae bacterium]
MKKSRFRVTSKYYNNGKVEIRNYKKGDVQGVFSDYVCYIDTFPTKEERKEYLEEVKKPDYFN